jgi:hypothetical protein
MILRLLGWQGIAGVAVALALSILLVIQKVETRQWKKESGSFEQLYRQEQSAFATTVANYRLAADQARAADQANMARVTADQAAITERTANDYQVRIAAARAESQRLRSGAQPTADSSARRNPPVPGLPAAPGRAAQGAGEDELPAGDALTATEQAIQLDELIKWVRAQAAVDNNSPAATNPPRD